MHLCAQKIARTHLPVRTTQPSIKSNGWSLEAYGKSIRQNHRPYIAYINESYQQLSSSYTVQVQAWLYRQPCPRYSYWLLSRHK
jgi:hypothetical protein